ncbi:hypothetical protein [Brevundimonas sp.]|uniref:hypothetical protein n=1 Tax=Brevundimonas sp. TaxID=1871086 RepID=UPI00344C2C8E
MAAIDFTPGERADSDDWMGLGNVDLTDPAAAQTAVNAVVERFGRIDSLLNAVGGFVWQTADGPLENWDPAAGQGVRRRTASLARPGRRDGGGWGQ